ncbi:hypothetical protein FB382_001871 [Nocardioides ginsengisegetis]|uniref:Helix-turn-helix domain-containing protein n=1 Tax=Nocardioides ginsengisegetis TaxID=661491 RepID=A0A7W3P9D8_9ACTN|nr:helix-turn-helix domain-containing protein [Nocardioides ginsengisegetis]MBA8803580.1 hypothetical protein [Nocardioides ginsengisegetis]
MTDRSPHPVRRRAPTAHVRYAQAVAASTLSPWARLVALVIADLAQAADPVDGALVVEVSADELARQTGMARSTALKARNELRDAGYLRWQAPAAERWQGRSCIYLCTMPTAVDGETSS